MYFWRLVGEVIGKADIIIIVGDARMPALSTNPKLMEIIEREKKNSERQKEIVKVFTKADICSEEQLARGKLEFPDAFFVAATKNEGIGPLRKHLLILAKRMKLDFPKVGVVGYPNVGKSALINVLARGARARVADKPGTTRGIQWVRAGTLRILDSPGVIPVDDKSRHLALIGAKHAEKVDNPESLALEIISKISEFDRHRFVERYGISKEECELDAYDIMLAIGRKRGFLSKGGVVDEMKTALVIIREWQKGRLKI